MPCGVSLLDNEIVKVVAPRKYWDHLPAKNVDFNVHDVLSMPKMTLIKLINKHLLI